MTSQYVPDKPKRPEKEVVNLGNHGQNQKGFVEDDGSEFISASRYVWDQGGEEESDGADLLEKLDMRAAAAAAQRKKPQRRAAQGAAGVAKFGGGRAQLGGGGRDLDLEGAGSLEQLELQFVREMDDGARHTHKRISTFQQ